MDYHGAQVILLLVVLVRILDVKDILVVFVDLETCLGQEIESFFLLLCIVFGGRFRLILHFNFEVWIGWVVRFGNFLLLCFFLCCCSRCFLLLEFLLELLVLDNCMAECQPELIFALLLFHLLVGILLCCF